MTDLLAQAVAAAEEGNFQDAAGLFERYCASCPHSAAAQHRKDSKDALSTPADAHKAHEMLAQCLMELDQYEHAYQHAQHATSLAPTWPDAQLTLGRAARSAGLLKEAAVALQTCLGLCGNDETLRDLAIDASGELLEVDDLLMQQLAAQVGVLGLKVLQRQGGTAGLGGVVWDAGIMLSHFLVHLHASGTLNLRGLKVLELGSGTGLVGIVAATLGAQVVLTDLPEVLPLLQQNVLRYQRHIFAESAFFSVQVVLTDLPEVLPLLQQNVLRNQQLISAAGGSAETAVLDWSKPPEWLKTLQVPKQPKHQEQKQLCAGAYDVVIGADLVYNTQGLDALNVVMRELVALQRGPEGFLGFSADVAAGVPTQSGVARSGGTVLYVAHKRRHEDIDWQLPERLSDAGVLGLQAVAVGGEGDRVTVFRGFL